MFEEDNPFKVEKSLDLLGIEHTNNDRYVLNEISKYLFVDTNGKDDIIKQEFRNFDINEDYQYYFPDFLKYNINLNSQEIDWWEFCKILDAIILDENTNMHKIIGYRTYEKPSDNIKTQQSKEHKFRLDMKRKYALKNNSNPNNGFEKLWDYVEKKAGEIKE